jgi:DNA-binding winged helix-turn-helix (wHTH) protein/TolB-like protein
MHGLRIGRHILQPHRQLLEDGERVHLGARALAILSVLAEARGEIVTKDELMDAVWPELTVEENALQVHIVALRKGLGEDANCLETIRGVGYRLKPAEYPADEGPPAPDARLRNETPPGFGPATASSPFDLDGAPVIPRSTDVRNRMLVSALVAALLLAGLFWLAGRDIYGGLSTGGALPQVTVMPLDALGADEEQEALAAGITAELVNRLRRVEEIQVATGLASEENDGRTLRGSVRTDGDMLRLTARLEDEDGGVLWSQNFDRELTDLLFVQQEVAASIASALSVSLDVGLDSSGYGGTDDPEAYFNYFQGRLKSFEFQAGVPQRYFQRAVELDPNYVLAWTELSYAYARSIYNARSQAEADALRSRQDEAAARALEAGPDLWMGQAARGWFELASGDMLSAAERFRRVEELDGGDDPELRNTLANFAHQVGRLEKALEWRRSKELIDPIFRLDVERLEDLVLNGHFDEAIQLHEDVRSAGVEVPGFISESAYWAYLLNGDVNEARQLAEQLSLGLPFTQPLDKALGGDAFPDLPRDQLAVWADERFGAGGRAVLARLAVHAGYVGRQELAMDYLELAYGRPGVAGYYLLWHPSLTSVRQTQRFEVFVEREGFVALWRETGDWGDFCRPVSAGEIECT